MRQVLMEAIHILTSPDLGIAEDLANGDSFVTLRISPDFVNDDILDNMFTLGVLCSIFMIKTHAGPDPISPALLQAAIGGLDSIVDMDWIRGTFVEVWETFRLIPVNSEVEIPNITSLRRLFESRMAGSNVRVIVFLACIDSHAITV